MENEEGRATRGLLVDGLARRLADVPHACIASGASIELAVIVGLDWVRAPSRDRLRPWTVLCEAA
ncbi:hypothetical protein [Xanthomonas arboricola]|uniref:hypothetical protein n=1 Tax=Xanthomonas arboricola TaxID=56448 RepID=UPI0012907F54|nr:hypothetical protein [Xanthomonas arboricola]